MNLSNPITHSVFDNLQRDAALQPRAEDVESELHVRFAADAKDDDDGKWILGVNAILNYFIYIIIRNRIDYTVRCSGGTKKWFGLHQKKKY